MWQDDVKAALDTVPNAKACFMYPAEWPEGTVITYAGLGDAPAVFAGNAEYATEISVKVDVWDFDPEKVRVTVEAVKAAMSEINFIRSYCVNLFEPAGRMHHTSMRFRRTQPKE